MNPSSILSLIFVIAFGFCNFQLIQSTTTNTNSSTPHWHNGQIPYVIDSNVTAAQHCLIHSAMYHIAWRSCVRFREKSSNDSISSHYLQIQVTQTQNQCMSLDLSSPNGSPKSVIRLSPECFQMQTIVYLLVHTLGIGATTQNNVVQFSSTRTTTELTKQETESMNRLYSCSSLVKLQMGFIKQFVKHREQCSSSMNRKSKIVQVREPVKLQNFSIYLLTYNVDEKNAPSDNLSDLFNFDLLGSNHDIYVIALQDLSALTLITRDSWMHAFDSTLWVKGYSKLERKRNMYTTLSIYVKKEKLSEFNFESINFGGRRGGSAIRMKYKEVTFAFVGAHFTGGSEEQRIKDYHSIIESVKFNNDRDGILEQDYAFFMGVLNSRFENLTRIQLYDSLVQNPSLNSSFDGILRFDQLNKQRSERIAFSEFEEPKIKFAPTYKFVPGTNDYNWKKASPAYTDRILYRNKLINKMRDPANRAKVTMQLSNYDSLNHFVGSDRKPVRAIVHIPMTAFELVKQKTTEKSLNV